MAHEHGRDTSTLGGRLLAGVGINTGIMLSQIAAGLLANSLALVADGLHNLSDVAALGLSYGAYRLGLRPATERHTFAFKRGEVLAALLNASALIAVAVFVTVDAIGRLRHPEPVAGIIVMVFAAIGVVANGVAAWLLRGQGESLNVRSAMLHLVSDSVGSLGVLVSGLLIELFGWYFIDPLVSIALSAWFVKESVGIVRSAVHILLEGVPEDLDLQQVAEVIKSVSGVVAVHDLHVWALSSESSFLSAHLVLEDVPLSATGELLCEVKRVLHDRLEIEHATLEVETAETCSLPPGQE